MIPQQDGQLDADSSVTPFTTVNGTARNNYSFAVARVRLKGIAGTTSAANVKVFFRLWGTQTAGPPAPEPGEHRLAFTGKVVSLVYDRFGDFSGFTLDTEDGTRRFAAREPEIERVVHRAWAERILTSVLVERDAPRRPEEIVLHSPPGPLAHLPVS